MKIRGNESGAEVFFLASYFLIAYIPNKTIAQNPTKISKITTKNLTYTSSFIIVVHFTLDN